MVRPIESQTPDPATGSASRVKRTSATSDRQAEHTVNEQAGERREKENENKESDQPLHAEKVTLQGKTLGTGEDPEEDPESLVGPSSDHIDVTG